MPLPLQDIYTKQECEGYIFEQNVTIPLKSGLCQSSVLRANVFRPLQAGRYPVLVTLGPCKLVTSLVEIHADRSCRWKGLALLDVRLAAKCILFELKPSIIPGFTVNHMRP